MTDKSIFAAALALGSPAERAAYLDRACAADPGLRRQVEELLAAHAASNPLDRPPADLDGTGSYTPTGERPGATVGPYKLLQQIGEGGMGTVYMAEQTSPVRRKVALKIVKPGLDSKQVVARFEAERQALSLMDHPNIAKVLDAGATASGRPYFVMDLVHGVPITQFCDANKLTPRERLALFVPVCQAIQHAHQKGVIHRDIKPSNVLVTRYDDKPVPKVIDFGVAKAIEQRLTERTLFTQFGALVGTFEYMSPEQAEMNALGVDTRSDVYSLGVLLYELLTGTTPLERPRLRGAALGEVVRLIKEEEPPRPSRRLSSSNALAQLAAERRTEPALLSALVRGELDWIALRCLEKDRTRRYDSASALARDVERYLKGEAVEACPPTVGYRLRKFGHKHRVPIVSALVVAVALLAVTAVSVWQANRAGVAEADAARERDDALESWRSAATERDNVAKAYQSLRRLAAEQRRTLYATSLNLAQAAWESGDPARTFDLLRQQIPRPGEDDLRGFEWHYWDRFAHQDLKTVRLEGFREVGFGGRGARLCPDGTRVAAVATDPAGATSLRLWDAETGRVIWRAPVAADSGFYPHLAFGRDGRRLVSARKHAGAGGTRQWQIEIRVWDATTGMPIYADDPPNYTNVTYPALSADGALFAVVLWRPAPDVGARLQVRRLPDGKEVFHYPPGNQGDIPYGVAFAPDRKRVAALVTAAGGLTVDAPSLTLWDVASGRELRRMAVPGTQVWGVVFSPDGGRVATALHGGATRADPPLGQQRRQATPGSEPARRTRAVYRRLPARVRPGQEMVGDSRRRSVPLAGYGPWARRGGRAPAVLVPRPHRHGPRCRVRGERRAPGHAGPGGDTKAVGPGTARAAPADAPDVGVRQVRRPGEPRRPAGRLRPRAGGDPEPRLRLTDGSGRPVAECPLPRGFSRGQAFSLDGRTLAVHWQKEPYVSSAPTVHVWDAVTGKELCRLVAPAAGEGIGRFAVSPDGARIVTLTWPAIGSATSILSTLTVWETATGRALVTRPSEDGDRPTYSPDGRWLACLDASPNGAEDRLLFLDARTGGQAVARKVRPGILSRADRIVFSRDGRHLAVFSLLEQSAVTVWETDALLNGEAPEPVVTLTGHGGNITGVEFSPDGRRILTAGGGIVKLWDAASGRGVLTLKAKGLTLGEALFGPDGRTIWGGLDEHGRLWGWDGTPVPEERP